MVSVIHTVRRISLGAVLFAITSLGSTQNLEYGWLAWSGTPEGRDSGGPPQQFDELGS